MFATEAIERRAWAVCGTIAPMRSAPEVAATPVADSILFHAKVAAAAGSPFTRRDDPLTVDCQKYHTGMRHVPNIRWQSHSVG